MALVPSACRCEARGEQPSLRRLAHSGSRPLERTCQSAALAPAKRQPTPADTPASTKAPRTSRLPPPSAPSAEGGVVMPTATMPPATSKAAPSARQSCGTG